MYAEQGDACLNRAQRRGLGTEIVIIQRPANRPNCVAIFRKPKAKLLRQPVTSYASICPFFYSNLPRWNWELKLVGSQGRQDAGLALTREGLTVAIRRKVKGKRPHSNVALEETVPAFSYNPDKLAPVIVSLWTNPQRVLQRDGDGNPTQHAYDDATAAINAAGFDLERAVIISEEEHDDDYTMQFDNEVVFVLPDRDRAKDPATSAPKLLETAKLLMACTPNGI